MKLAIVADWLPTYAGAEHVIAEFHSMWPDAPIFTTVARPEVLGPLKEADIRTSYLQPLFSLLKNHRYLLPLMPRAMERIGLTGYDTILSSSHAVGKGIIAPPTARHVCYCHTPMRYAWEMEQEYLEDSRIPTFLHKRIRNQLSKLRRWDMATAKRVDQFIANSTTTQERIERIYNRDAIVVNPPVEERFFSLPLTPSRREGGLPPLLGEGWGGGNYFLALGRMVPYKRFDLLIEAANHLQLPLKIAGTGPDHDRLKKMAGPTVEFLGFVDSNDLPELYANATAFLFPQFEDAGVVPVEAQACGTPVIAFGKGGVLDTVQDEKTGVFFAEQTVQSLEDALKKFKTMRFDPQFIREHAAQFSAERFRGRIEQIVRSF